MSDDNARRYTSDAIDVLYRKELCIHAGVCVRSQPEVFNTQARPWVDPGKGEADAVAEVVARCPTDALRYERKDGGPQEAPEASATVSIRPNGPLFLRGDITIKGSDGEVMATHRRVALCRCGASKNKPYCDGAHRAAGFQAGTELGDHAALEPGHATAEGPIEVRVKRDGPLELRGKVTFMRGGHDPQHIDGRCMTCRCGASRFRPFCDGAHNAIGFKDPGT